MIRFIDKKYRAWRVLVFNNWWTVWPALLRKWIPSRTFRRECLSCCKFSLLQCKLYNKIRLNRLMRKWTMKSIPISPKIPLWRAINFNSKKNLKRASLKNQQVWKKCYQAWKTSVIKSDKSGNRTWWLSNLWGSNPKLRKNKETCPAKR